MEWNGKGNGKEGSKGSWMMIADQNEVGWFDGNSLKLGFEMK
jgi:hypothetical protein